MYKSKLISLLRTFDPEELSAFEDFIASPYFNKRAELPPLCRALVALAPDFPPETTTRERVYARAFDGRPYDEKEMAYLMNYLLRLGEQFLGLQRHYRSGLNSRLDLLAELIDRGLEKHYQFHLKKAERKAAQNDCDSSDVFLERHRLAHLRDQHFKRQDQRRFDLEIQVAAEQLDQFYYNRKLRALCDMVGRQRIFQKSYRLTLMTEVMNAVQSPDFDPSPGTLIYFHTLKMLTNAEPQPHFQRVIELFQKHFSKLSFDDKQNILSHALNFCIRQIRLQADKRSYMEEALHLYTFGIEQEIFLDRGHLSPWHFKNVIKLAFNLKQHDWAEQFIQTYAPQLPAEARENALYYNLADLYYQKRDYDQALRFLNRVAFTDIHYQLNAKTLLLKIFYELKEEEALLSTLAAFTISLKRNKNISIDLRKTYQNFCSLLHKILRRSPQRREHLRQEILDASPLTSREWLLGILKQEVRA